MAYLPLSEPGDAGEQYFDTTTGKVVNVVRTDSIQRLCYEHQKEHGFTPDHAARRVAHIDLNTVKLLAVLNKDSDAHAYLYEHDTKARDRMINRYPTYFKACYGGI